MQKYLTSGGTDRAIVESSSHARYTTDYSENPQREKMGRRQAGREGQRDEGKVNTFTSDQRRFPTVIRDLPDIIL